MSNENDVIGNGVVAGMRYCIHEFILNFGGGFPKDVLLIVSGVSPVLLLGRPHPSFRSRMILMTGWIDLVGLTWLVGLS